MGVRNNVAKTPHVGGPTSSKGYHSGEGQGSRKTALRAIPAYELKHISTILPRELAYIFTL